MAKPFFFHGTGKALKEKWSWRLFFLWVLEIVLHHSYRNHPCLGISVLISDLLSVFHILILTTALSSHYVFVILISETLNCNHYFELLDLMLKMDLETLIGESWKVTVPSLSMLNKILPAFLTLGGTGVHCSTKNPHRACRCCHLLPLLPLLLSAVQGQTERSSDTAISQGSSSQGGFLGTLEALRKGWSWLEGQQLHPSSPKVPAGQEVDWGLEHKVCINSEMRAAVWQWGAWIKFHSSSKQLPSGQLTCLAKSVSFAEFCTWVLQKKSRGHWYLLQHWASHKCHMHGQNHQVRDKSMLGGAC